MSIQDESILISIKKLLGIMEDDTSFDTDIIIDINSALFVLYQLGVGPKTCYKITGSNEAWGDFLGDALDLEAVKQYVFQKVRLMFDTSTLTSPMIDVINRNIAEFEWRLNIQCDPGNE